jgi:hypothetical protein
MQQRETNIQMSSRKGALAKSTSKEDPHNKPVDYHYTATKQKVKGGT